MLIASRMRSEYALLVGRSIDRYHDLYLMVLLYAKMQVSHNMLKSEDHGIIARYQQHSHVNATGISCAISRFQASK